MIRVPAFTCLQWGIFLVGGCLFFELNYRYWYMFMEQYSIFLYAGEYFRDLSVQPGGMSQYLSAFVMQCFHLPFAAPVCVTLLLGLMTSAMLFIVRRSSLASSPYARLLCFVPAFLFFVYPVESVAPVTAAVLGLSAAAAYSCIGNRWIRAAAGFALVTILYPLAAPAHFVAAASMLAYECIPACEAKAEFGGRRILSGLAIVAWAALLPLLAMRTVYVAPMREIFIGKHLFHPEYPLPASFWYIALSFPAVWTALVIMSRKRAAAPAKSSKQRLITLAVMAVAALLAIIYGGHPLEQAYMYDSLAREGRWEAIAAHASTHPVRDKDALVYANLAYAYTGAFNDNLMRLRQIGEEGFIPHDPKTRLGLIEAAEVAWLLNHTNAAQRFAFVGVLSSERNVQTRLMRRLIETYIVNEEYKAAAKYIGILEKTAFHKSGMEEFRRLLTPEASREEGWVAERRRLNPVTDNPHDLTKTLPRTIASLLDDHPDNKAAFAYGMGYLLLYKDLGAFMHYMEPLKGEKLPVLYQEAICLFYTAVENNPEALRSYSIDPAVYSRFRGYVQSTGSALPALLARQYGDTYYYYAQFIKPPERPV